VNRSVYYSAQCHGSLPNNIKMYRQNIDCHLRLWGFSILGFSFVHDNIRDFEKLPATWLLLKNKTSKSVHVYIRRHLNGLPYECPNWGNCSIHSLYFVVCKTYVFRERVNIGNLSKFSCHARQVLRPPSHSSRRMASEKRTIAMYNII